MSTPDRLAELQRQRALVQQHLAQLDREIAAESAAAALYTDIPAPTPAVAPLPPLAPTPIADADAEAILNQYRSEEISLKTDVRKGCMLYAAVGLALMIISVFGLYFLLRH